MTVTVKVLSVFVYDSDDDGHYDDDDNDDDDDDDDLCETCVGQVVVVTV